MAAITRGGPVPAAIVARELDMRVIDTPYVASYAGEKVQEEIEVLKSVLLETARRRRRPSCCRRSGRYRRDGKYRAILPKAHVATVYAKPLGRPFGDTFITEVSQDSWIYFPWDLGLSFQAPIAVAGQGRRRLNLEPAALSRSGESEPGVQYAAGGIRDKQGF